MKQVGVEPTQAVATPGSSERRSVLQNALSTIERLQARLDASDAARHEPIAIIGMSCRVPGGVEDPDAYWQLLAEGRDVVSEVPPDRWDVDAYYDPDPNKLGKSGTKAGGFLSQIDRFEPGFFGMSPREAAVVDPQQRILLEASWEALEHAAVPADQLDGSRTGVFIGITSVDYSQRIDVSDPERSDFYFATGTALNAAAGRISFTFGFRGPCMAIDTACSSSLVAIHAACQSLRNGESNLALAGGVNCILSPDPFVLISKWGMLAPDGRCKTFDASANGFVRGEGCGLIVLERLSDAVKNGRRVLGVIAGSAINQDGRSSGLTVPNGLAQQEVIRQALDAARLKPADVSYVEAHGTGTSLGDPIEVEALAAVYGHGRSTDQPFEIGSVKSNVGHLEAASGVISVIKLVLALQHQQLPASLHVRQLTPAIPWERLPVRVSTSLHRWLPLSGQRIGGVSAFGASGMNAHVLLREAPADVERAQQAPTRVRPLFALPISARNEAGLAALAERFARYLNEHADVPLEAVCATAAIGRSHLALRKLLVGADREELMVQLRAIASGGHADTGRAAPSGGRSRIAFLFTGQGAQHAGMGRDLDLSEPVFSAMLDRCAAVLDPLLGRSLRELLFESVDGALDQTGYTQPALYALQVSLAALWRSWGIEPAVVTGHSVGEFAAAAVAGVFSIEDGARLIAARARLMQALPAGGAMVSVQGDVDAIRAELAGSGDEVSIAAVNAPGNVVISGAGPRVDAIAARLAARNMRVQPLQVSHAFHSPLMAPMLEEFRRVARTISHAAPALNWISNLTGVPLDWSAWGSRMADYWTQHVREPVLFQQGMAAVQSTRCDVFVEIGPHPTLIGLAQQSITADTVEWLPSLHRKKAAWEQLLDSVARLYGRGVRIDWRSFHHGTKSASLALPTYPFQRERYLVPFAERSSKSQGPTVHVLLGVRVGVAGMTGLFQRRVQAADPPWLLHHRIASQALMPMTAYLEACLAALRLTSGADIDTLEDVEVAEPMPLRDDESRAMQVVVDRSGTRARARVFSRDAAAADDAAWMLHATAWAGSSGSTDSSPQTSLLERTAHLVRSVPVEPLYERLRELGIDFGSAFRSLETVRSGEGEAVGEIGPSSELGDAAGDYLFHPAILDACLHVGAVAMESIPGQSDGAMYLLTGVDRFRWLHSPDGPLRAHAKVRPSAPSADQKILDVHIETLDGQTVALLEGVRCRRATRDLFRRQADSQAAEWLYEVSWQAQPFAETPGSASGADLWIVFDEGSGRGQRIAEEIERSNGVALRVVAAGDGSDGAAELDPDDADAYAPLLADATTRGHLRGIVSLWPLRIPALDVQTVPSELQRFGTQSALWLLQALQAANLPKPPRIWFVTAGTQPVDGTEQVNLAQAPLAGMVRVAATEQPDWRVTHVDLDPQARIADVGGLVAELLSQVEEPQLAWRKGVRYVARLARRARRHSPHVYDAPLQLVIDERGTLENLALSPMKRRAPGRGEVELRVHASGLNFRDVLSALGLYPGELARLGSDCAGVITAIGEGVTGFTVGDRVVAMADGSFASHAVTRWEFVAPLPRGLDFEQGAAIPTAYLTAEITLNLLAGMKQGDSVLIHSGAGGVGMAAIALALRAGAIVFATAGSAEKRAVLAQLGVHHVLDSRSTSFGDEVLRITGGRGVDIVLNSLHGALLDRSFDCVAHGGAFLEIGKRDLWSRERVAALGRGIRYHIVDCNDNARDTPELVGEIFARVLKDIESGALPRLPCTTFPFERAADAFRFMAQARHIGRVVFRHHVEPRRIDEPVRADASYLVTGGLKGLGLLTAQWLVGQGARHLVLAGRNVPDATALDAIRSMESAGARVMTVAADLATDRGVARVIEALTMLPPLGGVLHGAAVLDDGVLVNQTVERFATVLGPKADGAWRLHAALLMRGIDPDFFVMYSSLSAVMGAAGQSNYVAANAFLDALAHYRRSGGRAASSVAWGAWSEIGMATRGNTMARAGAHGLASLTPADGLRALDLVLRDNPVHVAVAPIDWGVLGEQLRSGAVPPLLRDLISVERARGDRGNAPHESAGQRIDFSRIEPAERLAKLSALVRQQLATVLGLGAQASSIAADQPFGTLGLDSLTAVELRNRLQVAVGKRVSPTAAFEWPTIAELSRHLETLLDTPTSSGEHGDEAREELTL